MDFCLPADWNRKVELRKKKRVCPTKRKYKVQSSECELCAWCVAQCVSVDYGLANGSHAPCS